MKFLELTKRMNIQKINEELDKLFEQETLIVTMTHDTEGELEIFNDNGYSWSYNGQYSENNFKFIDDCIKDFKQDMRRQGFYNVKVDRG